ncbi:hypothetical protein HU200_052929 [Digitaria exilis]|uniref:AIPP2-like SPOC-like domain-containing protein n=1 Tax=Digitaria exilis TaxID=1010633 RepID=A0A835E3N6_9POAL|nr:hypothetical protein HU200_052929 [Digitaria exilis]
MHKRDQLNVGNDITNNANNTRRRKELQHEEKPKSQEDNFSEGENPTHIIMKKRRRYIEINEDEDDNVDESPEVGVDSTRLTSRDGILKDCHDKISVPFVVDCLKEHNNCWSKPIDEPFWSGLLQVGNKDYIPLSGHLSTKSCEKVHNLSKSLTRVIEVTKLPRLKVWPKRWEGSSPINDNIGLYFFPHKMRFDKYHDQLLKEVMENDLALRSIVDGVEMLMFPSTLLPKQFQTFQMKHYLWGVFKAREVEGKDDEPDHTTEATTFAANATTTAISTDAAHAPSIPNDDATNAPTEPNSSSIGATPSRMLAFVVKQTPRLEQLIREMQREGALVMQGEMINTIGSWPGLATMTQCGSDMSGSPGVHPRDQVSPQLDKRAPSQHGGGCYKQQAF